MRYTGFFNSCPPPLLRGVRGDSSCPPPLLRGVRGDSSYLFPTPYSLLPLFYTNSVTILKLS
ncbi:MAG: hypothetical protein F6K56_14105 [Moorea sp. SIO3G5]|nr:hypothetical protein [Moorena sp. SIO3G5]